MRQSKLFTKTSKTAPKDADSSSHRLLVQAGYIDQLAAGVYTLLPLGLKVYEKIAAVIREEINAIGGQEILMPGLTPKDVWQTTGRWDNFDALFKLQGGDKKDYALGATHEEIVVPLAKKFINSYKDLPLAVYQIQTKFRNEKRAKSGILRLREFSMKDLYSFHISEQDLDNYYATVKDAYQRIFKRLGIGEQTYITLASGGSFAKYSHEFQTLTPAGEDLIYLCQHCHLGINKEIKDQYQACPTCGQTNFKEEKAVEVGNIFKLMTKYSAPFNLKVLDEKGQQAPVLMGCYGLGLTRLIGAIVEVCHDDQGLIWPSNVAPFTVHLIALGQNKEVQTAAEKLYQDLKKENITVLFDDRPETAGSKFADADLLGLPWRVVISEKLLAQGSVELKARQQKEVEIITCQKLLKKLKA